MVIRETCPELVEGFVARMFVLIRETCPEHFVPGTQYQGTVACTEPCPEPSVLGPEDQGLVEGIRRSSLITPVARRAGSPMLMAACRT